MKSLLIGILVLLAFVPVFESNAFATVTMSGNVIFNTNSVTMHANYTTLKVDSLNISPTGLQTRSLSTDNLEKYQFNRTDSSSVYDIQWQVQNSTQSIWKILTSGLGHAFGTGTGPKFGDVLLDGVGGFNNYITTQTLNWFSITTHTLIDIILNQFFVVTAYKADNSTLVVGSILQSNSTASNKAFTLSSGTALIPNLANNQNFSVRNFATNFIVKKQYNVNASAVSSLRMVTNDFLVDCPSDGSGSDIELFVNSTDGHRISTFTTPVCLSNNTMSWSTKFTANGNNPSSYTTSLRAQVLNNTFGANPVSITANGSLITSAYSAPWIISTTTPVGTGLQTILLNWKMVLGINPAYVPTNYTAGNLNVTGSNTMITPITFSQYSPSTNQTVVTVTYPATYNLTGVVSIANDPTPLNFTNIPSTHFGVGQLQSTFTFNNASNSVIKLQVMDQHSKTNGTYVVTQPNGSIPLIQQIVNFRNGYYGTHGQFGYIDLTTLIVLIFSMVGMNRVNETLGLVFNIIVIGALAFFGILSWPAIMAPAIAMVALVTIGSTKKLPWS